MKPKILHIETSSNICSVSLSEGNKQIATKSIQQPNMHAKYAPVFIKELLTDYISADELDAIAVSIGPGSYTGLRIGLSLAKGLAYASNKPIIAINTLAIICANLKRKISIDGTVIAAIDARRDEVFAQLFDNQCAAISDLLNIKLSEQDFSQYLPNNKSIIVGSGAQKIQNYFSDDNISFYPEIMPTADGMIDLALEKFNNAKFENLAYLEPVYMKPFIAIKPKNKVLGHLKRNK